MNCVCVSCRCQSLQVADELPDHLRTGGGPLNGTPEGRGIFLAGARFARALLSWVGGGHLACSQGGACKKICLRSTSALCRRSAELNSLAGKEELPEQLVMLVNACC